MAQKFGNARWVKEGYFDNRIRGRVVGQIVFASLGLIDFYLSGDLNGEITGQVIQFRNPKFLDDPYAGEILDDFAVPQIGKVSMLSFDPHALLAPHPYFEWFSMDQQHYRIELDPEDAWIVKESNWELVAKESHRIHEAFAPADGLPAN